MTTQTKEQHLSYRRILTSTSIVGGAAAINIVIGMVRSKVVAELLGTEGMGVMGLYLSISTLAVGIASFGLSLSGTRELAAANGAGDLQRVQDTRLTFRWLSWMLGLVGTLVMALAAEPLSRQTFSTDAYTDAIRWLSLSVLLSLFCNYFSGIVQASGDVLRLGKIQVAGAIGGAVASVLCFILLREEGIVPALIAGSVCQLLAAGWWTHSLPLATTNKSARWSQAAAINMLTMGGVSVLVGVQASFVAVLLRRLILQELDLVALGLLQAAQALSCLYANYILGAMAADFLPRLTIAIQDKAVGNRMVNDQTVIALLLGMPGLVGTIVFAPIAVPFFYSEAFIGAIPVLQVMTVAMFARLLAWPLGMILVAVDARRHWALGELLCSVVQIIAAWLLLETWGLLGVSLSMIVMYTVCIAIYYHWVHRITGFSWNSAVAKLTTLAVLACGAGFAIAWNLTGWLEAMAGLTLTSMVGLFCLRQLARSSGITRTDLVKRVLAVWDRLTARFLRADRNPR